MLILSVFFFLIKKKHVGAHNSNCQVQMTSFHFFNHRFGIDKHFDWALFVTQRVFSESISRENNLEFDDNNHELVYYV